MNLAIREEIEKNPISSFIEGDDAILLDRFVYKDGSKYVEVDQAVRKRSAKLQELFEHLLDAYCYINEEKISKSHNTPTDIRGRLITITALGQISIAINYRLGCSDHFSALEKIIKRQEWTERSNQCLSKTEQSQHGSL